MVKKGFYAKLIAKLMKTGIVELVSKNPKEINGLFGVPEEGDKQRLILDSRCAIMHFTMSEGPELLHPGYLQQMTLNKQEETWVGKLDIENFYHRLAFPVHLCTYFGLPPVLREGRKVWPQLKSGPM